MHRHNNLGTRSRIWIAVLAVVVTASGLLVERSLASDHQDTADVELNPSMDMTDVYAFPGSSSDRIALVLDSWALLTPAEAQPGVTSFDDNLLYQFKVDNTGDAKEDKVIQVTFHGSGADQTVEVRGPMAPPVLGAMRNTLSNTTPTVSGKVATVLGSASGMQVFAGPRQDPFYIDLEQFFRIIPDRKPVTGPLSQLPDTATAGSFRSAGSAVDILGGSGGQPFNVLSIVIELPASQLRGSASDKIGIWGTISR
jgi:hypothetical protein